jgi:hypothetical protein
MLARDGIPRDECTPTDWHELAERYLIRLTEAEHDVAVVRDRLDYLQSSHRMLLRQSEERLIRIHELERELAELHTARSRLRGALDRWLALLRPRVKAFILFMIGLVLRVPLVRPAVRRVLRTFPGLGDKLRARLLASRQAE